MKKKVIVSLVIAGALAVMVTVSLLVKGRQDATEVQTGLPTTPQAPGAPWIMRPGTASSHIMVVQPREPSP